MNDAPERIWAAATKWAVGHGPELDWRFGHWKETPATVPDPKQEYLRADTALALVAEAYEVAAEKCDVVAQDHIGDIVRGIGDDIRALASSDALAAREARDKRVRDEALREWRGVTVRPLEWVENPDKGEGGFLAESVFGVVYHVQSDAWSLYKRMHWHEAESTEAAKSAAQADYERRILSALSPAPERED